MCPSKVADGEERGWIVPIGGAEDKEANPKVLKRFVDLCGGEDARIAVIPTASRLVETGIQYERLFPELGAARVDILDFDTRRDASEQNRLDIIEAATGVFFTGGNQLRLSTLLGGTPVAKLIRLMNARGVTVERVLSDNGGAYRSHLWRDTCAELGIRHKRTRPYRPQTNGKIERFHRTLADGWAYARCYTSEAERRGELDGWLHYYNHHRPHTACGNQPPFSRLTNVSGQYT